MKIAPGAVRLFLLSATLVSLCATAMKFTALLFAAMPLVAWSEDLPPVLHPDSLPVITAAPGVTLRELSGMTALAGARSDKVSVARLMFYAITSPAWSSADDVLTAAPSGAPK
jgi:hypothetical protein